MRTLLLADDSITVQRVIALTFADEPIRVVSVSDGQQALDMMASMRPDVVLAGTTLPQVNGYDLATIMRGRPELKDVPLLLLSGAFETVDDARLKASGAKGFLEKPVEPTIVIGRVKELLGLKSEERPATAGRLVTSAESPAPKLPVATPPRAVTSTLGTPSKWEQLRDQTGLDANTKSVEDPSTRSDDYLDTLDAAFDNLDQQLSGRVSPAKHSQNPSGPIGQSGGALDPRSPGRRPQSGVPGNPVFEVDDEWFGAADSQARADAKAGRRQIQDDLRDPECQPPAPAPASSSIFEVDDEWFAEDNKARAAKAEEQHELAEEMGIHDVDLPAADASLDAVAPGADLDFDFGLDDIKKLHDSAPVAEIAPIIDLPPAPVAPVVVEPEQPRVASANERSEALLRELTASAVKPAPPAIPDAPAIPVAPAAPVAPVAPASPVAPAAPVAPARVADDFEALLAYEQGEQQSPPVALAPAPEIRVVTPEITGDMLEQIAARVAERLNASLFGDQLKAAMTDTVRETVRSVVSETSERLVRDEIDRIKSKNQDKA